MVKTCLSWVHLAAVVSFGAAELDAPVKSPKLQTLQSDAATVDWSQGEDSWQQATDAFGDTSLWKQPNECDSRVLHSSAPLTVLFGVSTFWNEIKQRRASLLESNASSSSKPLEVHVLGAAFPFEGRSDWSLLASRRPKDIPGVRVVLVLGTPWQTDNVPVMKAKEFDDQRSFLMQFGVQLSKPETGKVHGHEIQCSSNGSVVRIDESFRKVDLCRDHGNGLEVVCIEKLYQEVSSQLPKPDVVAMFSPGFPQIARRAWDLVLRNLLAEEVPVMVCDLLYSDSIDNVFKHGNNKTDASPGSKWPVRKSSFEDGMTLKAMRGYSARKLGAFRNPFPIFIKREVDDVVAKNAVLQVFRGRLASAKPLRLPSPKAMQRRARLIAALDLKHLMDDEVSADEIKSSMLIPTSKAYDKAMWQTYRKQIKHWVHRRLKHLQKHNKPVDEKWLAKVESMGLTGKPRRRAWNLKDWIFVLEKLKVADTLF